MANWVITGGSQTPVVSPPAKTGSIALFGTGLMNTGAQAAQGSVDAHYALVSSDDSSYPGPNAMVCAPVSSWVANGSSGQWIAPRTDANSGNAPGNYTYRTTFDLTGFDPATARVTGQVAVDNSVTVTLNGGVATNISGYAGFSGFSITTGFLPGLNTLEFVVNNGSGPTGLCVQIIGTVVPLATGQTVAPPKDASLADKATFFTGFGNPILVGTDSGARHIVSRSSTPSMLLAYLNTPPVMGSFTFDVKLSQDNGLTWNTILRDPISINSRQVVQYSSFASGLGFAPGNLLRLDVLSAGTGPFCCGGSGFAMGFQCVLVMQGAAVPGWDRAAFLFGIAGNPPVGRDFGGYYIVARPTAPSELFLSVMMPPVSSLYLDFQVLPSGGASWSSILAAPLLITPNTTGMITSESFNPLVTGFNAGDLVRPYIVSGPKASGMGYNAVLEMEVIS